MPNGTKENAFVQYILDEDLQKETVQTAWGLENCTSLSLLS
jgi:hypothetical protein